MSALLSVKVIGNLLWLLHFLHYHTYSSHRPLLFLCCSEQGICGSCWSFGSAESIEGAWFIKTQKEQNVTVMEPMSQQALMDCSWPYGNNACDGGESFRAFNWVLSNGFIPTEASYGVYKMADGYCHVNVSTKVWPFVHRSTGSFLKPHHDADI